MVLSFTNNMREQIEDVFPEEDQNAYWKVQYWFFAYPEQTFSLSEIAQELHMHKHTASKIVKQLEEEGFVQKETIGNIWRIGCNKAHTYNTTRKIPYHLQLIYESNIVEHTLSRIPQARAIILFGSYRKGDDISTSDIDIAVEVVDNEPLEITQAGIIKQLGYRTNVPANIHIFSRNNINLNLFNNIANGIILHGFLEVRI